MICYKNTQICRNSIELEIKKPLLEVVS